MLQETCFQKCFYVHIDDNTLVVKSKVCQCCKKHAFKHVFSNTLKQKMCLRFTCTMVVYV